MRAVVLVSGGAAVTPFTTPEAGARTGLAAGNTMTAIRAHLIGAGHAVFTAPARIGAGVVAEDAGWQGFADVPEVLSADVTINAVGTVDGAGQALRRFLRHLAQDRDVAEVDLIGHSMGGLFSRAAIAAAQSDADAPKVATLITVGTPWAGSLPGDFRTGDITLADARGDRATESILQQARAFADAESQGAADDVASAFLAGPDGWNERQRGALDEIPVALVAGDHFQHTGGPDRLWPHDGLVQLRSALAREVSPAVLPDRKEATFDDVHSIFFADQFGLPWERALTWDPAVLDLLTEALRRG